MVDRLGEQHTVWLSGWLAGRLSARLFELRPTDDLVSQPVMSQFSIKTKTDAGYGQTRVLHATTENNNSSNTFLGCGEGKEIFFILMK